VFDVETSLNEEALAHCRAVSPKNKNIALYFPHCFDFNKIHEEFIEYFI
jgi:hypothetical protein